jgi:hypothetical protein
MNQHFTLTIVCFVACLFLAISTTAQYKAVTFDREKVVFGENQPLPAESHLMIQGQVRSSTAIVELDIFDQKGKEGRLPLYTNQWKRTADSKQNTFQLPVNFRLKSSAEYDFKIKYYARINDLERVALDSILKDYLMLYLEQAITVNKNSLSLEQNERQIMRSLNKIVYKGLNLYRNRTDITFDGFSDLIQLKLQQIRTASLRKGKALYQEKEGDQAKVAYRNKLLDELRAMIGTELDQYLSLDWYKMVDSRYIDNYSTEKGKRTVAIQAGFGGAYLSGTTQNLSLGASPYAGFAFPLSQRPSNGKFLNNLSVTFGVFILDFEGANNSRVSGPIFKRPTYVGASYKLFRFVHLNAGATFLEDAATAGQLSGIERRVFIRPFIGVSAQIDVWLDFSK